MRPAEGSCHVSNLLINGGRLELSTFGFSWSQDKQLNLTPCIFPRMSYFQYLDIKTIDTNFRYELTQSVIP